MSDFWIHPTAVIEGDVQIGADSKIWHFCKILGPATIGERCNLGQNVVVERGVQIGNNVKIQNNVSIYSGVILEDDVFCGPSMVFTNILTPRSHFPRRGQYLETRVCRGASIGANATILCGHQIGAYAMIGAGSVMTHDAIPYGLYYGNPARLHGFCCYCGEVLKLGIDPQTEETAQCICGRRYQRSGLQLKEITNEMDGTHQSCRQ